MIGYSPSTVSKAFSGAKDIKSDTREEIFRAAKQIGIFEKFYKSPKKNKTVAVIVPEFNSGLYVKSLSLISEQLSQQGAVAVFSENNFSKEKTDELISYYSSGNVTDGIIVFDNSVAAKKYTPVPVVFFGKRNDPFADSVYTDIFTGICETIFNFKLLKHAKIAFIGETNTTEKENEFKNAMRYCELTVGENYIVKSDLRHEDAGRDGMKKLLALPDRPTAVLAAYDDIAIGAVAYAKERGLSAPKDFSIVGMDNSRLAENGDIMLSSIDYHVDEICKLLVSRLWKKIDNPNYCIAQKTEIKSSLVIRNSIGPCPDGQ